MSPNPAPTKFFAGEFSHGMDGKGRLTIPVSWRLSDADSFYFFPDSSDRFLRAMRPAEFALAAQNHPDAQASPADQMEFQRYFCSRAHELTADKQGRLVLPEALRAGYGVQGEIMLVGTFNSFEVWNKELWEETKRDKKSVFQRIAAARGL
jgi:MraZ protein